MKFTLKEWDQSKNWLIAVDKNVNKRKSKYAISCSICQHERIISYAQSYNILKGYFSRDCNSCRINIGLIKSNICKLYPEKTNFNKKKKYRHKNPKLHLFYRHFFTIAPLSERKKLYRKKSQEINSKRLKTDKVFYAMKITRNRARNFMKSNNLKSYSKKLGCTLKVFKNHIESQFKDGMSWDNYGKWHLDHIYPLSVAIKQGDDIFLKACHYTNLQPLWAVDNIKKSNKVFGELK